VNQIAAVLGNREESQPFRDLVLGLLHDVALEMEVEDGVIWVYGVDDDGVLAFTDFGVESLVELIKIRKESAESKHT